MQMIKFCALQSFWMPLRILFFYWFLIRILLTFLLNCKKNTDLDVEPVVSNLFSRLFLNVCYYFAVIPSLKYHKYFRSRGGDTFHTFRATPSASQVHWFIRNLWTVLVDSTLFLFALCIFIRFYWRSLEKFTFLECNIF